MSAPRCRSRLFTTSALGAIALAALWAAPAQAQLVQGASPAQSNGSAPTIDQSVPGTTTVGLGGSRTVIDWDRFDINSGDTANFVFANRSDIVLNRVGGAGSTINGDLNGMIGAGGPSGGNIWIYNANGVVIGANARINTGGLLVTAAAVDRADDSSAGGFLDGSSTSFNFSGAYDGTRIDVRSGAQVNTHGGALALISPILNTEVGSTLTASGGGNVLYGSASSYKVSFRPTSANDLDLISFEVAAGADGAGGYGGTAYLQGDTSGNRVFVSVVSQSGLMSQLFTTGHIQATNVAADESGAIVLTTNHNIVNGAASVSAVAGSGNATFTTGDLTGPDASLVATGTLLMNGAINAAGGNVSLLSETGNIHQNGPKITANTLSASAAGYVELGAGFSGTPNSVARLNGLTSTSGYINFAGDNYEIAGPITTPGAVGLSSTGTITGTGLVTASSLSFDAAGTINVAGNANIDSSNASGDITINAAGGIAMTGGMRLNNHVLTLNAATGNIIQTGDAIYNYGTVRANAAGNIDFGSQTNYIDGFYGTSAAGDISVKSVGSLTFGVDTPGHVTIDAGGVAVATSNLRAGTLGITAGNYISLIAPTLDVGSYRYLTSTGSGVQITTNSAINIGGNVTAASSADVNLASNAGAINQTAGTMSGRQVLLSSAGSITQASTAKLVAGTYVDAGAGGDLLLAGTNDFGSSGPKLLAGTGRDVTIRSLGNYNYNSYGSTVGTLRLISDTGSIGQWGGTNLIASALYAEANTSITLYGNYGNKVGKVLGLRSNDTSNPGNDTIGFYSNISTEIAGDIVTSGEVNLSLNGAFSGSGTIKASSYVIGGAGTLNLDGAGIIRYIYPVGGNLTLNSNADMTLALSGTTPNLGHLLTLNAASGSIRQIGSGGGLVGSVAANAVGDIDLAGPNEFTALSATSTGGGDITANTANSFAFAVRSAGAATITTGGDANAIGVGVIDVGTLAVTAGGAINLDFAGGGAVYGPLSAGGNISIAMDGNLVLADDVTAGSGASASLTSRSGAIVQNAGTTLAADSIALNASTTISQGAGATLHSTNLSLNSGGNVTLGEANNFTTLTDLAVGGDLTLRNFGNINLSPILGGTGGYRSGGALTLVSDTGNILTTNSGIITSRLNASAAGSISLDGTIASLGNITAGQHILLTTYNGSMDLTGNVTGTSVSLYADTGVSQSGGIIDTGRLNVITNGAISLTGANQIDVVGRLDTDRYDFGTGHDITLRNAGAILLDYLVEAPGGTVTLTADSGGISQSGFSAITAATLNATAPGLIMLDQSANNVAHLGNVRSSGGAVAYVDTDGFDLTGQVRAAGTLSLMSGGAIATNGGLVVTGGLLHVSATSANLVAGGNIMLGTINTSGNFAIDTDQDLTVGGTISTNGNTTTLTAASGAIHRGSGGRIMSGTIVANAQGGIDLGGDNRFTNFTGASTGGGNITLNSGDSATIFVGLSTTGSATVTAAGNFASGGITVDGLSVDAGHIDLTNSVDVNRFNRLAAAYGDVLVTNNGSFTVAGDITTNRPGLRTIDLRANGGGISQTAGTISGHYVSLRGAGDLIQSGTARVDSNAAYFSGWNVLLGGANNLVSNDTSIFAAGDLTLRNAGSIDLTVMSGYTAGGALSLTSDTGSISATGAVTASALTALAANGAVSFSHADNLISEIRGLSASTNATVRSRNGGFTLTGDIDVGGTLSLHAGTGINQTGGRIKAATLDAQLYQTMTTGSVLLGGANDVDNLYVLAGSGGGDVLYRDIDGFRVTYAVVGNHVTLTTDAGAITEASGTIDGIQANYLTVSAVDGIALNNQWNGIRTISGLSNSGTGGIDVGGRGANMAVDGNIVAAGQAVSLTARNGSLTQTSGGIIASSLSASAVTGIALTSAANNVANLTGMVNSTSGGIAYTDANAFNITGNISAAGQALSLRMVDASAYATQNSTSQITAGLVNLSGGAAFGLTGLGGTNNHIAAIGDINTAAQIYTTGNVDLTGTIASPYFELWAQAGDITQSAGHIDSSAPGSYLEFRANNIALTSSSNQLGSLDGLISWGGGGNITAVSSGNTNFEYISGGAVSLTVTGGNLTSNAGGLDVNSLTASASGTIALDGRIGVLGNVTAGGDAAFRSTSNLAVNGAITIGTGRLSLGTGGALSQTSGSINAGGLEVNAAGTITMIANNNVATIYGLTTQNGAISYSANSSFALAGDITVGGNNAAGLNSSLGSITQTGGIITAGRLDATARDHISLTGANRVGQLGNLTATNAVSFTARDDLTLVAGIAGSSVTLSSTDGAISQTGGFIDTGILSAHASTGLDLFSSNDVGSLGGLGTTTGNLRFHNIGGIALSNLIVAGDLTLQSDTGAISQDSGTAITVAGTTALTAQNGINLGNANAIARLGTLTNSASGGILVNDISGDLDIAGVVTAAGQAVRFDTAGTLTQSAGLGIYSSLTINAGTGIILDQANHLGATALAFNTANGDITLRNVESIAVSALAAPGTLRLISDTGTITQTGVLTANTLIAEAQGDVTLTLANRVANLGGLASTSGGVSFSDADGFNVTGDIRTRTDGTPAQAVRLDGGTGNIVQTGGGMTSRALFVNADGDVLLGGSNNHLIGLADTNVGGDFTLRVQDGLRLVRAVNVTGTARLTSATGALSQDAGFGTISARSLYLDAVSGIDFGEAGNSVAHASLITAGGHIGFTTQGALDLLALSTPGAAMLAAGSISQSAAINVGGLNAAAQTIILTNAANRIGTVGDITATGPGTINIADADGFDITGNLNASGAITLSAGSAGAIRQTGGIITASALDATGASLSFDRANAIDLFSASAAPGGALTLRNQGNLVVDAITAAGGTVSLTSNSGAITQASGGNMIRAGRLNADAGTSITLGEGNHVDTLGTVRANGAVSFNNAISLTLDGDIVTPGGLTLNVQQGVIAQSSGAIDTAIVAAAAQGSLSLSGANRVGSATASRLRSATGDVSFRSENTILLAQADARGTLRLTSDTGDIRQTAGFNAARLDANAAGDIWIDTPNMVGRLGDLRADGEIRFANAGGFDLDGDIAAGSVIFSAGGAIVQTGGIVTADIFRVTATGGIDFGGANRVGLLSLRNLASGDIRFVNGRSLTIDLLNSEGGNASVTVSNGNLVTTGLVSGVGSIILDSATGISALETIDARGSVRATSGGDISLTDVIARDDIYVAAGGDATVRALAHLAGTADAAGDGYNIDIRGANATFGASSAAGIAGTNSFVSEVNSSALLAALAGNATVNLASMDGPLSIGATGNVNALAAGTLQLGSVSGTNVTLTSLNGAVDATLVAVANDYRLVAAAGASGGAIQPIGARAGRWTMNLGAGFDAGGRTLEYGGDMDFTVGGLFRNGSVHSLTGAVTIAADSIDLNQLVAATGISATTAPGHLQIFSAQTGANDIELAGASIRVFGSLEAGRDVIVNAANGAATLGYATAGRDISVSARHGDATLRQANLLGATGDLRLVSEDADAILGAQDSTAIQSNHLFSRAAGSTGTATIQGVNAVVNLHRTAALTRVEGDAASVNIATGDLTIDQLIARSGDISASTFDGAFTINEARAALGAVQLAATGGNLNIGLIDAAGYVSASAHGGNATLRSATALGGLRITADGDIILGADTVAGIGVSNTLALGGCGCAGATLVSNDGDILVNLYGVTGGGFDAIDAAGDATVRLVTGDLAIGALTAGNIDVEVQAGVLDIASPTSRGGNYTLAARDFAGNALAPIVLGGGTLNNVSITDLAGGLAAAGSLRAAGDILVRLQGGGALTGSLSLHADGGVGVSANGIQFDLVRGRDVSLDAGGGAVDLTGSASVARNYTLQGSDFSAAALSPLGARAGALTVTDTFGTLDYSGAALVWGGNINLTADGALVGGDITSLDGDIRINSRGMTAGALVAGNGIITVASVGGDVDIASAAASRGIAITALAGRLGLGSAALTANGMVSLNAGGDIRFGAAGRASITGAHHLTLADPAAARISSTGGRVSIHLDRATGLGFVEGQGAVRIAVDQGDLVLGDLASHGADVDIEGPGGALRIGRIDAATGARVRGNGDVTLGAANVAGDFDLTSAAGDLSLGTTMVEGQLRLAAGGAIGQTGAISAAGLAASARNGITLLGANRIDTLGAITVTQGDFALNSLSRLALTDMIDVANGTLDLRSGGAIGQGGGVIVARRLIGTSGGGLTLGGANRIDALGDFAANGTLLIANDRALVIDGAIWGATGATIRSRGAMTMTARGTVASNALGDAIILASDGTFRNLRGADALSAANGRWLVYSQAAGNAGAADPANGFGGLAGRSYYGAGYDFATGGFAAAPGAGNRFVYGYRPVLTVRPDDIAITYNGQIPVLSASLSGLVNGDRAADAWSGAASITGAGRNAGSYTLGAALGTLASDMNYDFAFGTGTLRIDPRALTASVIATNRTYDGTTAATGTLGLAGLIAGDIVGAAGSYSFDNRNAGTGKTVTATGISLSGADAGNYIVAATATGLADIFARTLTATLTANDRVYDGTTVASGVLGLSGLIAGDRVGVTGSIAFDSRNAGDRIATATGFALSGDDAGNYVIGGSATDTATIARLAITGTATADSRIYDGTTATTGRIMLNGVLAGDNVSATAGYNFADPNAGTGRVVTVSGVSFSGADAGNYAITLGNSTALADILRRSLTVTADNISKIFGQPDPVLTYRITGGSLVAGDGFTGMLARSPGDQAGTVYSIGQGSLGLSANYLLTFNPGRLTIGFARTSADASDALRTLRNGNRGFTLDRDPSGNLEGDGSNEAN